jgi:hypothetical protein
MNIRRHVYGIREDVNDPNKYTTYFPFSNMPIRESYKSPGETTVWTKTPEESEGAHTYHAIVKVKPTIESNYSTSNNKIKAQISFTFEDIARKLRWISSSDGEATIESTKDVYKEGSLPSGISYSKTADSYAIEWPETDGEEVTPYTSSPFTNWEKMPDSVSNPDRTFYTRIRDDGF